MVTLGIARPTIILAAITPLAITPLAITPLAGLTLRNSSYAWSGIEPDSVKNTVCFWVARSATPLIDIYFRSRSTGGPG